MNQWVAMLSFVSPRRWFVPGLGAPLRATLFIQLALQIAVLPGCGQKDPNDVEPSGTGPSGPVGPVSPGPGDRDGSAGPQPPPSGLPDLLPLVDGASYTYAHSTGWVETVLVEAIEYEGRPAFLVSDTPNPDGERSESVFLRDGTRVYRVEKQVFSALNGDALLQRVTYTPGFIRSDDAWAEETVGTSMELSYEREEMNAGGSQNVNDRQHIFTVEATDETTTTDAGTFEHCVRVRRKRNWMTNIEDSEAQEKLFWFAPGVGKVREETLTSGKTELLIEYNVPE